LIAMAAEYIAELLHLSWRSSTKDCRASRVAPTNDLQRRGALRTLPEIPTFCANCGALIQPR
jgi:hypothetical protein